MNSFVVLGSVLATASAGLVAPLAGLPYGAAPAPYAPGYLQYGAAPAPYAAAPYGAAPYNVAPYNVAPAPYAVAPVAAVPSIPTSVSSQFQAQDEFGNVNYGYSNINSAKQEVGNAYGGVTGSYQYIDAHGIPQRVDYIADDLGFRVKATNLPVAPAVPALQGPEPVVYNGVAPTPVDDTPEVKAAKAEFFAAFEEAKSRKSRSVVTPLTTGYAGLPLAYNGAAYNGAYPAAYNGAYPGAYAVGAYPGVYAAGAYNGAYPGAYAGAYAGAYNGLYNNYAATPLNYAAGAYSATPLAYAAPAAVATVASAPAAREAVLTTIKLNPGHATSYRVD